jgi:hypothetical protein
MDLEELDSFTLARIARIEGVTGVGCPGARASTGSQRVVIVERRPGRSLT